MINWIDIHCQVVTKQEVSRVVELSGLDVWVALQELFD
jgi:hypothetical protein